MPPVLSFSAAIVCVVGVMEVVVVVVMKTEVVMRRVMKLRREELMECYLRKREKLRKGRTDHSK